MLQVRLRGPSSLGPTGTMVDRELIFHFMRCYTFTSHSNKKKGSTSFTLNVTTRPRQTRLPTTPRRTPSHSARTWGLSQMTWWPLDRPRTGHSQLEYHQFREENDYLDGAETIKSFAFTYPCSVYKTQVSKLWCHGHRHSPSDSFCTDGIRVGSTVAMQFAQATQSSWTVDVQRQ